MEIALKWIRASVIYYLQTRFGKKFLLSAISIFTNLIYRYNFFINANKFTFTLWIWTFSIFLSISILDAMSFIKKYFAMFRNIEWEPIPEKYNKLAHDMNVSIKKFGYNKNFSKAFIRWRSQVVIGTKLKGLIDEDEEKAIVAHEFAHNLWRHEKLSIVLLIVIVVIIVTLFPISITDPTFISCLFLMLFPLNWKKEIDADFKAIEYVDIEHLQQALFKVAQDKLDNPTWTHPSYRKRIEWLDKKT